ncbi:hypothetical protein [Virgibacillus sp. DJP39]|uniref:hypothetical protein n=1 Tax=Virgibacillus sp. DJP39 TaxID=3409790 RepID=UPI003BB74762
MLNKKIILELQNYIDNHLDPIEDYSVSYNMEHKLQEVSEHELGDFIKNKRKPTFQQVLFNFIDKTGLTDPEVYNKAWLDRKHFSKIRSNPEYRAGKSTILALALAIELNKKETDKLLSSAGYSFSDSDTSDLVLQFCFERGIYDIYDVNLALDYFSLKPLIG